jgi:hypothetical protein
MVGARDGNWIWNGSNWVCDPDCSGDSGFPPFGPPVFSGPTAQPPWYPGANGGISFGQSFPPNPVRGHLFWDGTTFWLFDGAAWVSIAGQGAAIKGVVDGSNAAPGFVGEFLNLSSTIPYAGYPTTTSVTVSTLIVPPGDWNLWASAEYSVPIGFLGFNLQALPAGIFGDIRGQVGATAPTASFSGVQGSATRGNFTVPTLLAFNVNVIQGTTGLTAGSMILTVCGRRAR